MDSNGILSMLGLALRGNRLVVGEEPVEAVVRARDARLLLIASDAADNTYRRIKSFAASGQCIWLRIPFTRDELGRNLGRSSAALVAVTDIGFASAIVQRLAQLDPEKYGEAAARLELKAKRAAERKALAQSAPKRPPRPRTSEVPEKRPSGGESVRVSRKSPEGAGPQRKPERRTEDTKPAAVSKKTRRSDSSRSYHSNRPQQKNAPKPYANSRPVKKGKGSFRKKDA